MFAAPRTRRFAYPEPAQLNPPSPAEPSHSIVIIDDSPTVRAVAEATLRRCGYTATAFAGGFEALAAFTRQEVAVPDLVLLDIELPKMDGFQIAQVLRSKDEFNRTRIVMLTVRDKFFDRMRARLVGASGYITKPFRTDELIEQVRGYLTLVVR
jgi:DNA-binding response OmpR family regulator